MYVTPAQLLEFVGAGELAALSFPDGGTQPDGELLGLTITGGDRSAYTDVEKADADAAAGWIEALIDLAASEIDSYRSPQFDPQAHDGATLLRRCAQDIARWITYDDEIPETVKQRYQRALEILAALRDGKMTLGDIPATDVQAAGGAEYSAPDRVFTSETLAEF